MKKKVYFFVDGFNFYHSLLDASIAYEKKYNTSKCFKWFNLYDFLKSNLENDEELIKIFYFSAYFPYKDIRGEYVYYPDRQLRHKIYLEVLNDLDITTIMGKFSIHEKNCIIKKYFQYSCSGITLKIPEEKKTDVNLGVTMLKEGIKDSYDVCYLVSGDTDFIPAIMAVKEILPKKEIGIIYPYNRHNNELKNEATRKPHITILEVLTKFILPNPYITKTGKKIDCPKNWL